MSNSALQLPLKLDDSLSVCLYSFSEPMAYSGKAKVIERMSVCMHLYEAISHELSMFALFEDPLKVARRTDSPCGSEVRTLDPQN